MRRWMRLQLPQLPRRQIATTRRKHTTHNLSKNIQHLTTTSNTYTTATTTPPYATRARAASFAATQPPKKHLPNTLRAQHLKLSTLAPQKDPYAVLGLPQDAPLKDVKLAYYQLALKHHPDRSDDPNAAARFAEVGAAYKALLGAPRAAGADQADADAERTAPSDPPKPVAPERAYPRWAHHFSSYLERAGHRFDLWLLPSYSSNIYHLLRENRLGEALGMLDEMRLKGEQPTHAIYEMLIRGCTIAMRRVGPGQRPDHLTASMIDKVDELYADMQAMDRKPDYWTFNELLRAYGKAGQFRRAMDLFEYMLRTPRVLPEERAFNSMYEAAVLTGHHAEALWLLGEQEELRKTLWKPRYTPVTFSLLLKASAADGPDLAARLEELPRVLALMKRHGILPRDETCENLLVACLEVGQLGVAKQVLSIAEGARHKLHPKLVARVRRAIEDRHESREQVVE